jgi:8-oxo-dGTP pyrophosphatase MutT (NUDIX family)
VNERRAAGASRAPIPTERQVSAGGVAYRVRDGAVEVALVLARRDRWQLPKGIVDEGESPAQAAQREVREEAGLETRLVGELETIEYWYVAARGAGRVRYHKFVHFFLLEATGGDVADHDHEVLEARWFPITDAVERLAFENERRVMEEAMKRVTSDE